jgi:translation initiation factor eIF-2B subunit alpha
VAVAAINALTTLIKNSGASTIMELEILLKAAQERLQEVNFEGQRSKVIQLTAACELFARHVTRTALDVGDFEMCKQRLIERGQRFAAKADVSRTVIAENMRPFLRDGMTILVHGYSNVVCGALLSAANSGLRFKVRAMNARGPVCMAAHRGCMRGFPESAAPSTRIVVAHARRMAALSAHTPVSDH